MRLLCYLGRHRRDRKQVRHDTQDFVSVCVGCGLPMRKLARGWVVDDGGA